jgi:hypothetical protein
MELGKEVNTAIMNVVTEILAAHPKMSKDENAMKGANIESAMKKLAIAIIEKARESTPA